MFNRIWSSSFYIKLRSRSKKSEKELNAHTYDVIAISSFTDTETNLYGGVIRQDQGYIVSYIDYNGEINMWELVPDDSHKIKISSDGTNTITITTAGFSTDEEVTLSVTKDMLTSINKKNSKINLNKKRASIFTCLPVFYAQEIC